LRQAAGMKEQSLSYCRENLLSLALSGYAKRVLIICIIHKRIAIIAKIRKAYP